MEQTSTKTTRMTTPTTFVTSWLPSTTIPSVTPRDRLTSRVTQHRWAFAATANKRRVVNPICMELNIGDRVRVLDREIFMYHFPGKQNQAVKVDGMTGVVIKDVSLQDGVKMSATSPYVVQLDEYPKTRTHFAEHELEVIEDTQEKQ